MDLGLVKFINSDLTWKAVKKGHRSMMRRPKRTEASGYEFGFYSGNKSRDSVVFDYEKSGVAILSQHFAEEKLDVPIKKRILLLQSPGQGDRLPQPHSPSRNHEMPKGGEHTSEAIKLAEKAVMDLNDFSGIELLATAACSSGHVEVEEHATPRVESYADSIKQDVSPMDSIGSSVQDNTSPVTQNLSSDDGNDQSDKSTVPSKIVRLHWDLNTVMEEWEEPCDIDARSKNGCLKNVSDDGLHTESRKSHVLDNGQGSGDASYLVKKYDAESCRPSKSDVVDSFVTTATCENVSTSTASVSLEETAIKVESDDKQAVSEVVQGGSLYRKGDTVDKLTSEDHLSDCCGSNVSQDKVKSGYDSPVEDGELREPDTHTWEKEELEEMECVDYESDNMYEDNSDTIESVTNETVDEQPQSVKASVSVQNSDIEQGEKVDALGHKHSRPAILVEKDSISKTFLPERKSMLRVDRTIPTSCIRRRRSERDFSQEGREGSSYRRGQWVDSYSRNKHESGGYPRPKNVRSGGSSSIDNNEAINYNPRSIYGNESYGNHSGMPPSRDISRGRSRVGLRRAPQEEYTNPDPYYSERKVPFAASSFNRGANLSRSQKQSRSRSRSGSPIAWHFQKKRNVDTKRQSPDYKPDTKFPFRKPSETEAGLDSQTTGRVIRRFDDRNINNGQYKERRSSPVGTFHRNYQRHDPPGYLGKLKSNDHFSSRFPPSSNYSSIRDDKYGMMNERRRLRYYDDDESCKGYSRYDDESCKGYSRNEEYGFRYARTESKCFRDAKYTSEEKGCRYTANKMFNAGEGHFHKDNLQRKL